MMLKQLLRARYMRYALLFTMLSCFCHGASYAQSKQTSRISTIKEIAPHLPSMVEGVGKDVFYGEHSTYAIEANESSIKAWVKKYPAEFKAYTAVIQTELLKYEAKEMPAAEKKVYNDLKAQWAMIQQMNLTYDTKSEISN